MTEEQETTGKSNKGIEISLGIQCLFSSPRPLGGDCLLFCKAGKKEPLPGCGENETYKKIVGVTEKKTALADLNCI